MMAFLFIWQFLISGPLELVSGLIALDTFSQSLAPAWKDWNTAHSWQVPLWPEQELGLTFSPARLACLLLGVGMIALLYRNMRILGKVTVDPVAGRAGHHRLDRRRGSAPLRRRSRLRFHRQPNTFPTSSRPGLARR